MSSSGSNKSNKVDGVTVNLYIILVFCSLVVTCVTYWCFCQKQLRRKKKAFQRSLKKKGVRRETSVEDKLLRTSESSDQHVVLETEDTNSSSTSDSYKTKRTRKSSPKFTSESPAKVGDKNKNIKAEQEQGAQPSFFQKIRSSLRQKQDVESGDNGLLKSESKTASPLCKKKEGDKGRRYQGSNSVKQLSIMNTDKTEEKQNQKQTSQVVKFTSDKKCTGSQLLMGIERDSQNGRGKGCKRPSSDCPGNECKKCKPFRQDDDVSQKESGTGSIEMDTTPCNDELKFTKDKPAPAKEPGGQKKTECDNSPPNHATQDDVVMTTCVEEQPTPQASPLQQPIPQASPNSYLSAAHNSYGASGSGKRFESVGDVYNILEYASQEWKGVTAKAEAVRKGYFEIPRSLGLDKIRVVRGDNYCAVRATLFETLVKKIPILSKFGATPIDQILMLLSNDCPWIKDWNFGGARLGVKESEVCKGMQSCLTQLLNLVTLNSKMETEAGRTSHLLSSFNYRQENYEVRLLEGVKLLMLATAVELHRLMTSDQVVPMFAVIMFARDSSADPRQFMLNHLNAVGDTGGLEQVEMHLLGYTLGIIIRVVRPSHFGQSDFIASYPEDMPDNTPSVTLVAEDDRHYNILS